MTDTILTLAFGVPFFLCTGLAAGLLVGAFFGVDLATVFRKNDDPPEEDEGLKRPNRTEPT